MKARVILLSCSKTKIVVMLFVFCFAFPLFSQNDQTNAAVTPPFVGKIHGLGRSVHAIQTRDGCYLTLSERRSGLHIVRKTKASGERVWEKSLSVQIVGLYNLSAIAEVNNGYVIVGYKWNVWDYDNYQFALIVFLSPDGTVKWNKVFYENGRAISFDYVSPSPDGGFIVTAVIFPPGHPILVKFSSKGDKLWAKRFDNLSSAFVSHPSADNGLLLASSRRTEYGQLVDANLIKVDQSGRIVWRTTLNLEPHSSIKLGHTLNNGALIATNPAGTNILTLLALRENGTLAWSANYSLRVSAFSISSVIPTDDRGYVVTGTTFLNETGKAKGGFLIKIDDRQNLVLKKIFGFHRIQERAVSVFARNANSYVLVGSSNTDLLFLNLSSDGVVPGCNFFQALDAERLDSPKIAIGTPTITESSAVLSPASTRQLILGPSRRRTTTICQPKGAEN
jgi:hypothetical protein